MTFQFKDRVKLSELGLQATRSRRKFVTANWTARRGTVMSVPTRGTTVEVWWDGVATFFRYPLEHIELDKT